MAQHAEPHLVIDKELATPLYHQVYLVLRENIRSGVYKSDRPMPTDLELCDLFDVSVITVKRAMKRLATEGLIERTRGRGTFVKGENGTRHSGNTLSGLLNNVMTIGEKNHSYAFGKQNCGRYQRYRRLAVHRPSDKSFKNHPNSQFKKRAHCAHRNACASVNCQKAKGP